jgi:hypothetical protein
MRMFIFRGCVVTMDCVEKLIKKDMLDPINSKKMTEKDIIVLQRVSYLSYHKERNFELRYHLD